MTIVSYAQNGEDVLLDRAFRAQPLGFYIDVGANDPVIDSVTKMFYDRGWCGINIEPGAIFTRLAAARPRDTNIRTALSDRSGSRVFYEFPEAGGLSTLSADARAIQTARCVQRTIPVTTLADVCRQHASDRTVDFLKIDVEGHEHEVLAGGDWQCFRPRILVIESQAIGDDDPLGRWEPLLLDNDYRFAMFDGLNRYYVRGEDERWLVHFERPLCCLDDYVPYRHLSPQGFGSTALRAARGVQALVNVLSRVRALTRYRA